MLNALLGKKGMMGQTYVEDTRVPVTNIEAGPCVVTQIKSADKDQYWAVQLGFDTKKLSRVNKPLKGHLKSAIKGKIAPRFLREVRVDEKPDYKIGDQVTVADIFKPGDVVAVTGTSKGKGFAGAVKRWGFAGGPKTHGQSDRHRAPGSIGQGTTPGRVWKGKKMAGRMGSDQVTAKNLVVSVDAEKNTMAVSGPVPGVRNGLLLIKKLASGKLSELKEETPQVQVKEIEETEEEASDKKEKQGGQNDQS